MGNILAVLQTPPAQTFNKVLSPRASRSPRSARGSRRRAAPQRRAAARRPRPDGQVRSKYQPDGVTSLEGLLFPDTYQMAATRPRPTSCGAWCSRWTRWRSGGLDLAPEKLGFSPYQVLIIASMIEREAKTDEDRPKIARVIYNRLGAGMPLQIDATLFYGQDPNMPFEQLKALDSPYNTYRSRGCRPRRSPRRAASRSRPR